MYTFESPFVKQKASNKHMVALLLFLFSCNWHANAIFFWRADLSNYHGNKSGISGTKYSHFMVIIQYKMKLLFMWLIIQLFRVKFIKRVCFLKANIYFYFLYFFQKWQNNKLKRASFLVLWIWSTFSTLPVISPLL